jgi:hypothetical protein
MAEPVEIIALTEPDLELNPGGSTRVGFGLTSRLEETAQVELRVVVTDELGRPTSSAPESAWFGAVGPVELEAGGSSQCMVEVTAPAELAFRRFVWVLAAEVAGAKDAPTSYSSPLSLQVGQEPKKKAAGEGEGMPGWLWLLIAVAIAAGIAAWMIWGQ